METKRTFSKFKYKMGAKSVSNILNVLPLLEHELLKKKIEGSETVSVKCKILTFFAKYFLLI